MNDMLPGLLFAEMTETVWLAIVAGVMLVVKQLLDWASVWFKLSIDRKIAADLKVANAAGTAKLAEHLESQDKAIQVVVKQTNGLIDEIKDAARKEGHESGEKAALSKLGIPDKRGL